MKQMPSAFSGAYAYAISFSEPSTSAAAGSQTARSDRVVSHHLRAELVAIARERARLRIVAEWTRFADETRSTSKPELVHVFDGLRQVPLDDPGLPGTIGLALRYRGETRSDSGCR